MPRCNGLLAAAELQQQAPSRCDHARGSPGPAHLCSPLQCLHRPAIALGRLANFLGGMGQGFAARAGGEAQARRAARSAATSIIYPPIQAQA